jgi:transcriptional regulator with XRE-family HTH domain
VKRLSPRESRDSDREPTASNGAKTDSTRGKSDVGGPESDSAFAEGDLAGGEGDRRAGKSDSRVIDWRAMSTEDEVLRFSRLLELVVRVSRMSTRELERRLEMSTGTLNRIFSGKVELKLRHILDIHEALELPPEEFFRMAYSKNPETATPHALTQELLAMAHGVGVTEVDGIPTRKSRISLFDLIPEEDFYRAVREAIRDGSLPGPREETPEK